MSAEQIQAKPTRKELEESLTEIIRSRPRTKDMPDNVFEAVKWFLNLFEVQKSGEGKREVRTGKGQAYWLWPYADRMKRLTKEFYTLDDEFRTIIQAAREDEVYWRGDEMDFFMSVIDETEKMRKFGIVAYRKQALAQMIKLNFK